MPSGTQLAFGVFLKTRLMGAVTIGVGPFYSHRLVEGASPTDCLTLSRLWLSDELPKNSESRVLGVVLRALKRNTKVRFLLSYADPAAGHLGTIYQATGWIYTGLSNAMPLYNTGDGKVRHSRTLAHAMGPTRCAISRAREYRSRWSLSPPSTGISTSWTGLGEPNLEPQCCPIRNGRRSMEVVDISIRSITPAPWNPNHMDDLMASRLRRSIQHFGVVLPLVVREVAPGQYETIGGAQRLVISREMGFDQVPCLVVEADGAQARLLSQCLNRIAGEDDLGLKAELVRELLTSLPEEELTKLLPETAESLSALASLGQEAMASHLLAWQEAQKARLKHLQFQLTPDQLEVVEEALARLVGQAKKSGTDSPDMRGTALYLLCRRLLELEAKTK